MKATMGKKFVSALTGVAICLLIAVTTSFAGDEKPTAELEMSVLSQYIWRGQELSQDSLVLQPSLTVEYKGFGFNLWGNLDTETVLEDTNNWNETDMTLYYGTNIGPVGVTGGYIYYALDGIDDSQEVFLSASLDTFLNPTITVYREFAHSPSWYITAEVSHSFALPYDMSLDLGAQASYLKSNDATAYPEISGHGIPTGDKFSNLHDGTISAALNIPVDRYVTVTPQVYWTFPLSGDAADEMDYRSVDGNDNNFVYGGISINFSF